MLCLQPQCSKRSVDSSRKRNLLRLQQRSRDIEAWSINCSPKKSQKKILISLMEELMLWKGLWPPNKERKEEKVECLEREVWLGKELWEERVENLSKLRRRKPPRREEKVEEKGKERYR